MAVILPPPRPPGPPSEQFSLEAVVLGQLRPAILVRDGSFQIDEPEPWANLLKQHRSSLEHAISRVGRLEIDNATIPWLGTAFLIEPMRAVTANFVAEVLVRAPVPDGSTAKERSRLEGLWINLKAEYGSLERERIAIRDVRFVHPYWGFAFLELAQSVDPDRTLPLASKQSEEELRDRDICVIGYPAFDVRNEAAVMNAIFRDIYDVKRVMPGKIMGMSRWGVEEAVALRHDATTSGGTSGAPAIDLATGEVLGIQVGGAYLALAALLDLTGDDRRIIDHVLPDNLNGETQPHRLGFAARRELPVHARYLRRAGWERVAVYKWQHSVLWHLSGHV